MPDHDCFDRTDLPEFPDPPQPFMPIQQYSPPREPGCTCPDLWAEVHLYPCPLTAWSAWDYLRNWAGALAFWRPR